jgi:phospholipid transport system substrate-binding protein
MPIPCLTRRSLAAVLAVGIALCGGWSSALQAQNDENPVGFLQDLQDDAINLLSGPTLSDGDREQEFRHLFNNNFDLPAIGRFVVGRYWKRASDEEREDFLKVFEDAMVQRFLPFFSADNSNLRLEFNGAQKDERHKGMYIVNSVLPRDDAEPVQVTWRVRYKDAGPRILDIVIEGASMAITLRSEYSSFVKANGGKVAKLTESLREKVERGAFRPNIE